MAREPGIPLALSVLFPFPVHSVPVPGDAQLGPRLLPMFDAPLLATLWGRFGTAAAVALLAAAACVAGLAASAAVAALNPSLIGGQPPRLRSGIR